ncbi:MAG: multiheme c-type cytochrome [Acidobacteriota bacterium]
MTADPLARWRLIGIAATAIIVLVPPAWLLFEREATQPTPAKATFVGREACRPCHQTAYESWLGSDHDLAMAEADETSVLGDFDDVEFISHGVTSRFWREDGRYMVSTEGPDGEIGEFEITYTFGHDPLQQYLIPFPGGRLQCLNIAWDRDRGEWFDLNPDSKVPPDDWLHWTRAAQTWNAMCAECHSTNLKKSFDPTTKTYHTTWSEIDVSCEACHGPASEHVAWAEIQPMARPEVKNYALVIDTSSISSQELVELCAPCHSRRTEMGTTFGAPSCSRKCTTTTCAARTATTCTACSSSWRAMRYAASATARTSTTRQSTTFTKRSTRANRRTERCA